jgi:hypothetical protein
VGGGRGEVEGDERIEVHVVGINRSIAVITHDDGAAHRSIGLTGRIRDYTVKPFGLRVGSGILKGGQVDGGTAKGI